MKVKKKKTAGIITFHKSYNYGAVLQTYALQKAIEKFNIDVELIDYRGKDHFEFEKQPFKKLKHNIWNIVKNIMFGNERQRKIDKFKKNNLNISKEKYETLQQIKATPPKYDIYISGSDQIWNPQIVKNDDAYLLSFAADNQIKVSYASSFGISSLPENYKGLYKKELSKYKNLSVREETGSKIINDLLRVDAEVVVDPSLLLSKEEWSKLSKKPSYEGYVLCYHMPGFSKVKKTINIIAKKIAFKNNLKIIHIGSKEYEKLNFKKTTLINNGIEEFLGLFQNADFILTNSFHGTCFSLKFQKNFFSVIDEDNASRNSRIVDFLKRINCDDRIISAENNYNFSDEKLKPVNYTLVNEKLFSEIEKSIKYIESFLKLS